jgi:hypothetical protein
MKVGCVRLFFGAASIMLLSFNFSIAQNPFIPKYDAVKRSERCFTVTKDLNNQFGSVWWAEKVDFSKDTLFNFVVYMGDKDANGADGLAFVMHQDPRDTITNTSQTVSIGGNPSSPWPLSAATGDDGGGLGYAMHNSRVDINTIPGPFANYKENHKIQPSVAIEIDTWNNGDVQDGKDGVDGNGKTQPLSPYYGMDHTSVVYNGDLYKGQQIITDALGNKDRILPLKPSYIYGSNNNIEDNNCYTFQVRWKVNTDGTQSLELWADFYDGSISTGNLQMIMRHTDDMLTKVFGGKSLMRFGFTGSTGGSRNEHTICLLGENLAPFAADDYASIPANTTKVIDVESNDNDPDGDVLHVPIIITAPKNGSAVIFDSLSVNFLRYTPNANYTGRDSLVYVTCDVNSTKCYAKCDTAVVRITVGCDPFNVEATALSPNVVCSDDVPNNGSASAIAFLPGTFWYEGFEGLANGTTVDNGTSSWSFSTSGSCANNAVIAVQVNQGASKFRIQNSVCEVEWSTGIIDISSVSDVSASLDLESKGSFSGSSDYIRVYYRVDGGPLVEFKNGNHSGNLGSSVKKATAEGINGNTLQIVVKAKNNKSSEEYFWDNLHIKAVGPAPSGVTYNWYRGNSPTGSIINTGAVVNGMKHGNYTVVAIDQATGCPSNPATITIDSTGFKVKGGFVEQIAPFTNCKLPFDGALNAGVMEGTNPATTGYIFNWYHQEDPKIPSFIKRTGALAQNLESREYAVIITELATGCDTTINAEVVNAVIIPTVSASALSHVTSCADLNTGVGVASVSGITSGFHFEWYTGPVIGAGPPNYTTPTVNTFAPGIYTVQATDTLTSCTSESRSITINDQRVYPDIIITVDSEQISCDPLTPTGQLSGAVNTGGSPTTSGYTFNWYKGPNDIVPARSGYTGGPSVDGLEAGTYRLVVVTDGTNCTSFADTLVQDNTVTPPDVTLSPTHVTHCTQPDGSIQIIVAGDPNDFYYELYGGFGVTPDSLLLSSNFTNFANLPVGNYTVIAIDKVTKCVSNPATTTITDATVAPVANFTSEDQISCDPNNPTGKLMASVGTGSITDYTFEWFRSDLSGASVTAEVGSNGEIISGLEAGDYVLRITSKTSQCTNVYYPSVNIGIVLPVVSATTIASTTCGAMVNGEINADVVGVTPPFTGYTFNFEKVADGTVWNSASSNLTGLAPGDYNITVTRDATACTSASLTVNISDNRILPTATFIIDDQIACDNNFTGKITAVPGSATVTDYTYNWFVNNFLGLTVSPDVASSGEIISGQDQGTYALRLTSLITECSADFFPTINSGIVIPVVSATTIASTACNTKVNGEINAAVVGLAPPFTGYTFNFEKVADGTVWNSASSNLTGLAPGDYNVTVTQDATACTSASLTVNISDNRILPTATFIIDDQIACDNNFTGKITAVPGSATVSDYTYNWFVNNFLGLPVSPDVASSGEIISGQDQGTYALRLTSLITECSADFFPTINSGIVIPVVSATTIASTACDTKVNGEINAAVVGLAPPFTGYTFNFEKVADGTVWNSASSNLTGLAPGDYNVTVTQDATACTSASLTVNISDNRILPTATFIIDDQIACDNNFTGKITAVPGSATVSDYTYNWFVNNFLGLPVSPDVASSGEIISGQDQGTYALRLTSLITECSADFFPTINSGIVIPVVSATTIASTACDTKVNGEINAAVVGLAPPFTGYTFNFEKVADGTVWNSASSNLTGLAPGDYNVTVTQDATACTSASLTVNISDNRILPTATFIIDDQIACDNNFTGKITAVPGSATVTDYTYNWFVNNFLGLPVSPDVASSGEIISGQDQGTYALRLTSLITECSADFFPTINSGIVIPVVSATTIASTACDTKVNGEINAAVVGLAPPFTGYTFNFEKVADGTVWNSASSNLTGLAPGDYNVTVTQDATACTSASLTVNISDNRILPTATFIIDDQIACDNNFTGKITAVPGSATVSDYTYNWFVNNFLGLPVSPDVASSGEIISGQDQGTYALRLTSLITECSADFFPTINSGIVIPVVSATTIASTACDTKVNGEINAAVVGVTPPFTGYTFNFEKVADGTVWNSASSNLTGLAPGDYNITVTRDATACTSASLTVNISDNRILPTATFIIDDQIACDNNFTGKITAVPGSATVSDYTYNWFVNNFLGLPVSPDVASSGEIISGQDQGTYALRLTSLITECSADFFPTINSGIVIPVVSATTIASTACDTKVNGEINAAVVGLAPPFTGYTFNFEKVADGTVWNSASSNLTGLALAQDATACTSESYRQHHRNHR